MDRTFGPEVVLCPGATEARLCRGGFLVVLLASAAPARAQITQIMDATGDGLGNLNTPIGVAADGDARDFVELRRFIARKTP